MQPPGQERYVDVLRWRIYLRASRRPAGSSRRSLPRAQALLAAAAVAIHELTYRQTGGDDFPLTGVISHGGSDMLIVAGVLVAAAALWSRSRP